MAQRTIIITGGSDGIGAAAARRISASGAGHRIILVGRSPEKTEAVAREIGCDHFTADFARLEDVRGLAARIRATVDTIDVLANNAGAIMGARTLTEDGHEKTLQVNVLAPFLLTTLLLDLIKGGDGVVVATSSSSARLVGRIDLDDLGNEKAYGPLRAYGDAKLAVVLVARGLHARGVNAVAFDPGNIHSNFASETTSTMSRLMYRTPMSRLMLASADEGGRRLAHFVEGVPGRDWEPGRFYTHTKPATVRELADDALADALWDRLTQLVEAA